MKIKNKIFICVCSFILMFCTMFSFMSISKSDNLVVSADEVVVDYTYTGSNFQSKVDFLGGSQSANLIGFPNFRDSNKGFTYSATNGTLFVNGTSDYTTSSYTIQFPTYDVSLSAGTYYLSYNVDYHYSMNDIFFGLHYTRTDGSNGYIDFRIFSTQSSKQHTFTLDSDVVTIYVKLLAYANGTNLVFDNFKIYDIMLTQDSTYPDYVPYRQYNDLSFKFDFLAKRGDHDYDSTFVDIQPIISDDNNYWLTNSNGTLYNTNHFTFDTNAYGSNAIRMNFVARNKIVGSDDYITNSDKSFVIYTLINKVPPSTTGYFDSNISRIVFGSHLNSAGRYSQAGLSVFGVKKYNFVAFYNSNGLSLDFVIPLTSNIESDYFDYRTYYITDDYDENGVYMNGYKQGYNTAKEEYTAVGYGNGYDTGYNIGYNNGFSDGVEDSNQYTFLNLISATIDAPLNYFTNLFNFELLGVNLQGFLTGLFTLCVIVTILKLCLGGK